MEEDDAAGNGYPPPSLHPGSQASIDAGAMGSATKAANAATKAQALAAREVKRLATVEERKLEERVTELAAARAAALSPSALLYPPQGAGGEERKLEDRKLIQDTRSCITRRFLRRFQRTLPRLQTISLRTRKAGWNRAVFSPSATFSNSKLGTSTPPPRI